MKAATALIILLVSVSALAQTQSYVIGEVSFFGYAGLPLDQIRAALPIREGDTIALQNGAGIKEEITQAVQRATGHRATDVALVCCDQHGKMMLFVGLPGESSRKFPYNPLPKESITLPQTMLDLYARDMDLNVEAVLRQPGEDRSKGYALSNYRPRRETQMSIREFALGNELLILRVLKSSASAENRRAAAHALGYARQSKTQILALVNASRDADDVVRNNAVRALGVLATSSTELAAAIPAGKIVALLNSGVWDDRNKSAMLLDVLTRPRDSRLLQMLRSQARQSLMEMARWKDPNHAWDARMILGRIAGIEEKRLLQLTSSGSAEEIISALN